MKRQMEISQRCRKFIYKHSDISIFAVRHRFFFFFFLIFFTCTGVEKIFLQINPAAVAFINILIAAWEGLIITKYPPYLFHWSARCLDKFYLRLENKIEPVSVKKVFISWADGEGSSKSMIWHSFSRAITVCPDNIQNWRQLQIKAVSLVLLNGCTHPF